MIDRLAVSYQLRSSRSMDTAETMDIYQVPDEGPDSMAEFNTIQAITPPYTPQFDTTEDDTSLPFGYPSRYPPCDSPESELYGVPHPLTWDLLQEFPKRGRIHAQSQVYQPNNWLIAKCGPDVHHSELLALLVLGARGFPVPRVLAWYREPQRGYLLILMQYVHGARLDTVWPGLEEAEKVHILGQMRHLMEQQRRVIMADRVMSLDGSRTREHLLSSSKAGGPMTQWDFFSSLAWTASRRSTVGDDDDDDEYSACLVHLLIRNTDRDLRTPTVLTHGDLVPRNILIGADNRIVAVLDWSQAGLYPESWEFAKACFNPARSLWSADDVVRFLDPHWAELNNLVMLKMLGPCEVCAKDDDCRVNHI
jgi:aminoglycoside/choline kinase family phosphotransferase